MTPIVMALFKLLPAMRKLRNDSDGSLRSDLLKECDLMRKELREERSACERRMVGMQNKQDAITRQFVQFQISVSRWMKPEHSIKAQEMTDKLIAIINTDVSEYEPAFVEDIDPDPEHGR